MIQTIIEICIYLIFALVMYWLAKKYAENNPEGESWDKYLICFILFFSLIVGIRWMVGVDCNSYIRMFALGLDTGYEETEKEYLWKYFVNMIHNHDIHWSVGLAVTGFIQIFFITAAVKRYPYILMMIPFVMFGGRYWIDLNSAVRQMTVACGFLWASKFIYSRSLWKYLLFVFLAMQIHASAIILLPLYLLPRKLSLENRRITLTITLVVCFLIGQTPSYQNLMNHVGGILEATGYSDYTDIATSLIKQGETKEALKFGPMMLTYLLIPIFIIWCGPAIKKEFGENIPYFNLWYNFAFLYACLYFLVCNISHLFIRPVMYLSLFQMVMASILLYYVVKHKKESVHSQVLAYAFMLIICTNTVWNIQKSTGVKDETATYKTFFMHKNEYHRWGLPIVI